MTDDYRTPAQVAALLGVTDETVRRWAKAGRIPSMVTPSGRLRIPADAVADMLRPAAPTTEAAS